jgi:hypothetical protein
MDSFALGYLALRFVYRIGEFLRHWYVKSMRMYWNWVLNGLAEIDQVLAWRITAKNLFQPLYKDYSAIGYVWGFLFRFIRLVFASGVYVVVFSMAGLCYLAWLLVPPFLVLRALLG